MLCPQWLGLVQSQLVPVLGVGPVLSLHEGLEKAAQLWGWRSPLTGSQQPPQDLQALPLQVLLLLPELPSPRLQGE